MPSHQYKVFALSYSCDTCLLTLFVWANTSVNSEYSLLQDREWLKWPQWLHVEHVVETLEEPAASHVRPHDRPEARRPSPSSPAACPICYLRLISGWLDDLPARVSSTTGVSWDSRWLTFLTSRHGNFFARVQIYQLVDPTWETEDVCQVSSRRVCCQTQNKVSLREPRLRCYWTCFQSVEPDPDQTTFSHTSPKCIVVITSVCMTLVPLAALWAQRAFGNPFTNLKHVISTCNRARGFPPDELATGARITQTSRWLDSRRAGGPEDERQRIQERQRGLELLQHQQISGIRLRRDRQWLSL